MALEKGPYIGDVTALCFAALPSRVVLAGTGAQLDCYNLETGARYFPSVHVFDGIRVHGIVAAAAESSALPPAIVAVHGEGKAKLFRLSTEALEPWQCVPRFSKWILDVQIFTKDDGHNVVLAIGLSDNTVCLWDTSSKKIVSNFHCPERCLLYSMRLCGDSIQSLQVAAGTIYNEVLVWGGKGSTCEAKIVHRLCGHEGSIYRITWSTDGCFLGSVSDDRSARIWNLQTKAVIVLFGHTARVWDLHIDAKMFITASEDCTCGVWSLSGELLRTLKGHTGRGIWRCIFDRQLSMLVTAGADSSIKLYSLSERALIPTTAKEMVMYRIDTGKNDGFLDSRSEYVRCLCFEGPSSLFIATNQGLLQRASLLPSGDVKQVSILQTPERSPLVCLDIFKEQLVTPEGCPSKEVLVACGDGQGRATVLGITSEGQIAWQSTWIAEAERQLLGAFWCKSLGSRFVFTTDPKGGVRCWAMNGETSEGPRHLAYFKSSLSSRIVCMDASLEKQVLVCGDQKGSLLFFHFDSILFEMEDPAVVEELDSFRGAHGISAVANVSISEFSNEGTKTISTGRDGCVCEVFYQRGQLSSVLSCHRVEKIAAITVLESVLCLSGSKRRIGLGFSAADFVLWDITNELKRISCGGWKRPHSSFVGELPETQFCFAFVKEQTICICRNWDDSDDSSPLQALQKQSHGREVHSILFFPDTDWLFSGSEDGRVQISRYAQEDLTVFASLEEHVGGSAVRALALSTRVYNSKTEASGIDDMQHAVLFSAGAKEVLTCWELFDKPEQISARWLSTHSTFSKKSGVNKDDLRYMALTVFAVESDGVPVYFVVAAMSNAILTVKAFDSSSKTWSRIAVLQHHKCPVLTLHHAVLPCFSQGTLANRFFVFSGCTDGSIAVWDLTNSVASFTVGEREKAQGLRPLSGRGSQGGKARRRLNHQRHPSQQQILKDPQSSPDLSQDAAVLSPVLVLSCCHQSGVNSLYVCATSSSTLSIVSGGDDQSLHFSVLSMQEGAGSTIRVLSRQNVANAHSSAVKGVWSDSEWIFSTGLDQRVRCWQIAQDNQLTRSCTCIIDVPETESIDAHRSSDFSLGRSSYRIAVAGRGVQVLNLAVIAVRKNSTRECGSFAMTPS
ncbi:WD repeat-containing protein 6 isoform X2 [Selaginella moellendorffii]|uniref:WD repeat-containing protein 6 isoform X2 n=1 Tax=Selaginella moellendorffii TaxID=88036 RepID=UPI000D1C683A|nr:WD repeat-containing protein 6 isoform X2 [Selaginella moellendorffii]|eukprot:XP_024532474.1 WD repeat-containing protein 6 isoform X2 [Selaginella moellendorffii]